MRLFNILKNDYIRLFIKRESRVVLGKNNSTLWLLSVVLAVTFLAIAFSNASLNYLSYKMDDPFINWVDIKNEYGEGDFTTLENALDRQENKEKYHYRDYQSDYYFTMMFFGKENSNLQYLKCRFFQDLNIPLVEAILSEDNVINDWRIADLSTLDNSIGVIMTEETMKKLGYSKAPAYIDYQMHGIGLDWDGYEISAAEYGIEVYEDKWVRVPIPVLAVVDRLPGNVDLISTAYMYKQRNNDTTYPFNLAEHPEYVENLSYFITDNIDIEAFSKTANAIAEEVAGVELDVDETSFWVPEIVTFRSGNYVILECYDGLDYAQWADINKRLVAQYDDDIYRIYPYDFCDYTLTQKAFISVHFNDLDMLREFENYVRDTFNVKIDMSQINTKENFNAVSTMGNILSALIIVFAIVCIILFIVNLLQSYFQKIKRNLGTFKAFGISNRDLISVYVLIMAGIIVTAIMISVSATWFIQIALHLCGILKDGVFDYLSLWSFKTVCSIVVIVVAAIVTVYRVMKSLLKATPGDLIYDRQ